MGLYKVELVKSSAVVNQIGAWRNVYHLNAASIGDANDIASTIINAEKALHNSAVHFEAKRISDVAHVEPTLNTFLNGLNGDQDWPPPLLPLWNVVVVNFRDASGGRQERKYYRVGLTETQIDGFTIASATLSILQDVVDELVSSVIAMCSPSGDTIVEGVVSDRVGMRQPHWHRRKRPGFHRGYVPD